MKLFSVGDSSNLIAVFCPQSEVSLAFLSVEELEVSLLILLIVNCIFSLVAVKISPWFYVILVSTVYFFLVILLDVHWEFLI